MISDVETHDASREDTETHHKKYFFKRFFGDILNYFKRTKKTERSSFYLSKKEIHQKAHELYCSLE